VIIVDGFRGHAWLLPAVLQLQGEELANLQVEINEDKTRIVDLAKGESLVFLGLEFRRVRSLNGVWRPHYTSKLRKRRN
jgi:RNA-directed DNA polymerase